MAYLRIELGTGWVGEEEVRYYHIPAGFDWTESDYKIFEQICLDHAESYGREYSDWCDENCCDPDSDDYWTEYVSSVTDYCCWEIIEDPDMSDGDDYGEW